MISAVVCRAVLMFELAGMRNAEDAHQSLGEIASQDVHDPSK